MNASAALVVAGESVDLRAGVRVAEAVIDAGKALEKMERLVELTNR